eukprot:1955578-Pyramimonas_sp.AAC.1
MAPKAAARGGAAGAAAPAHGRRRDSEEVKRLKAEIRRKDRLLRTVAHRLRTVAHRLEAAAEKKRKEHAVNAEQSKAKMRREGDDLWVRRKVAAACPPAMAMESERMR